MVEPRLDADTIKENEKIKEELDSINEDIIELKSEISTARKSGINTKIVEVKLLNLPPKIYMAQVTKEQSDVDKVQKLVDDIKNELEEAKDGDKFADALQLLDALGKAINDGDSDEASELYSSLMSLYRQLSEDQKQILYPVSLEMRKRIISPPRPL